MRVELIAAMSADGKIAENEGQTSLDWTSKEDTRFFIDKTKEAGVLIMGRKTFDTIGKPLKDRLNIIMTRSVEGKASEEGVLEYTADPPEEILRDLEERGFESVALAGGSSVYSQFLQAGLVTDLYLTVEPYLFGEGVSLAEGFDRIQMKLVDTVRLGEQAVLLHYQI